MSNPKFKRFFENLNFELVGIDSMESELRTSIRDDDWTPQEKESLQAALKFLQQGIGRMESALFVLDTDGEWGGDR